MEHGDTGIQLPGSAHLHLLHIEHGDTGIQLSGSVPTCTFYTWNTVTHLYSCQAVCPPAPSTVHMEHSDTGIQLSGSAHLHLLFMEHGDTVGWIKFSEWKK